MTGPVFEDEVSAALRRLAALRGRAERAPSDKTVASDTRCPSDRPPDATRG